MFQKVLLVPKPDYASRYLLWRQILLQEGLTSTARFDLSSLAKISDGYTAGHLVYACREVLAPRRVAALGMRPLQPVELVAPLARLEPVYAAEEDAFLKWYVVAASD